MGTSKIDYYLSSAIFDPLSNKGLPELRLNEILLVAKPKYLDTCPCMIEVGVIAKYKDCFSNEKKKFSYIIYC